MLIFFTLSTKCNILFLLSKNKPDEMLLNLKVLGYFFNALRLERVDFININAKNSKMHIFYPEVR